MLVQGYPGQFADLGLLKANVTQAASGAGPAVDALQRLGLSAKEMAALSPDRQLMLVAQAMGELGTHGEKVTVATQLFGKEGAGMVNMLAQGAEGLRTTSLEAVKLGLAISRVDAAKVEEANDAFSRVKSLVAGAFNLLAVKLAPIITEVANRLLDAATSGDGLGATISNVVEFGVKAVGFFADAWQGLRIVFAAVQTGLTRGLELVVLGIESSIHAIEWFGETGRRVSDLLRSGWDQLGAVFNVMAQGIRVGFTAMIDVIGQRLAAMIRMASAAMGVFSDAIAARMDGVAQKVAATTGGMASEATAAFDQAKQEAQAASDASVKAWDAMFAPIQTEGSPALREVADGLAVVREEQLQNLAVLRQQEQASHGVWRGYQKMQQAAADRAVSAVGTPAAQPLSEEDLAAMLAEDPAVRAERAKAEQIAVINKDLQTSLSSIWQTGLQERAEFTHASAWAQVRDVAGSLEAMTRGVAQHNKALFQVNKVAGIANSIVNTAEGVTKTLAKYPPPLGPILAGLVAAAGAVQIATIRGTQYGGGGGGAPSVAASIPQPAPTGGGVGSTPEATLGQDQVSVNGRAMTRQTLVIQGDFISAEMLERLSREAWERNILITEVRRG